MSAIRTRAYQIRLLCSNTPNDLWWRALNISRLGLLLGYLVIRYETRIKKDVSRFGAYADRNSNLGSAGGAKKER